MTDADYHDSMLALIRTWAGIARREEGRRKPWDPWRVINHYVADALDSLLVVAETLGRELGVGDDDKTPTVGMVLHEEEDG